MWIRGNSSQDSHTESHGCTSPRGVLSSRCPRGSAGLTGKRPSSSPQLHPVRSLSPQHDKRVPQRHTGSDWLRLAGPGQRGQELGENLRRALGSHRPRCTVTQHPRRRECLPPQDLDIKPWASLLSPVILMCAICLFFTNRASFSHRKMHTSHAHPERSFGEFVRDRLLIVPPVSPRDRVRACELGLNRSEPGGGWLLEVRPLRSPCSTHLHDPALPVPLVRFQKKNNKVGYGRLTTAQASAFAFHRDHL